MPAIQFRHALRAAMTEEMERDDNVFLIGEVTRPSGAIEARVGGPDNLRVGGDAGADRRIIAAERTSRGVGTL